MKLKSLRYLKQFGVLLMLFCAVIVLTGCSSKSAFNLTFGEFTIKFYDNEKQYIDIPSSADIIGIDILTMMKEKTVEGETWFINSLIISETGIETWMNVQELVDSNIKKLQLKLLKYTPLENKAKKIKCDDLQYSWYITTFSYEIGTGTIYGGQYFLTDDDALYLISLSSDEEKDIELFIKSTDTIACIRLLDS